MTLRSAGDPPRRNPTSSQAQAGDLVGSWAGWRSGIAAVRIGGAAARRPDGNRLPVAVAAPRMAAWLGRRRYTTWRERQT